MTTLALFLVAAPGCFLSKPNRANITLRKDAQANADRIAALEHQHDADVAQVRAMQGDRAVPTLPSDRLARLFTTSALKFKNIVVGVDSDPNRPGDEGFKIAVTPVDQFGDEFKTAGSFKVELFDLAAGDARIGTWELSTEQAQPKWLSTFVIDAYVLAFDWQTPPAHPRLRVKATFTEELTGRVVEAEHDLTVNPPAPTTTPAPAGPDRGATPAATQP